MRIIQNFLSLVSMDKLRKLSVVAICLLIMGLTACSSKQLKTDKVVYPSKMLNDFAGELLFAIEEQKTVDYQSMWHAPTFLDQVMPKLSAAQNGMQGANEKLAKEHLEQSLMVKKLVAGTLSSISGASARVSHSSISPPSLLIRFQKGDNYYYRNFMLVEVGAQFKIVDVVDHNTGMVFSDLVAALVKPYISQDQNSIESVERLLIGLGQKKSAEAAIQRIERLPSRLLAEKPIKQLYLDLSTDYDEKRARSSINEFMELHEDEASATYLVARWHIYNDRYLEAIAALKEFTQTVANDPAVNLLIAELYLTLGEYNQSMLHIKAAIEVEPYFDRSYWQLARAYSAQEELEEAMSVLRLLESYFGFEFEKEKFESDQHFEVLYRSAEFQDWIKQKY